LIARFKMMPYFSWRVQAGKAVKKEGSRYLPKTRIMDVPGTIAWRGRDSH
jgi:hypothetical protein